MPVSTRCPKCKARLKGPDNLVGHTLKCPGCGTAVPITADFLVPALAPAQATMKPQAGPSAMKAGPPKVSTNPNKASMYDDLEIVDDDLGSIDETTATAAIKTENSPRLGAVESGKPVPKPKQAEKKPAPAQAVKDKVAAPAKIAAKVEDRPPTNSSTPKPATKQAGPSAPTNLAPKVNAGVDDLFANLELAPESLPPASGRQPSGPKPPAPTSAPAMPNMELGPSKSSQGAFDSDLLQDMTEMRLQGDEEEIPLTAADQEEDAEVFDDFEILDEAPEQIPTLTVFEDDEAQVLEAMPVDEDDAHDDLEVVDAVDDLEEVAEPAASSAFSFKLLKPSVIFVQGQSGMFSINNAYNLLHGKSKKKIGEALEKKDDVATALRLFVGNNLVPTRIELLEGQERDLVLTIKRPPHLWTSKAEVFDNDDELLGSFEIQPFSALMSSPIWIRDHNEKKVAKMLAQWLKGKCVYSTPDDKKLAETMSQAVYEQRIVLKWAPRGGSFYITFSQLAEKKPRLKLLLLGVVIGIDLFFTQNRQGPIIGRR
jgi:hypothetical protein